MRGLAGLAALALLGGACATDAAASDSITLLHGITGPDEQAALQAAIDAFEETTGNTVQVEVSPDFDTVIITRVTGGNPPDVALYPQPGVLGRLVERGDVVSLQEAGVDVQDLEGSLIDGALDPATFQDEVYGTVVKVNVKSLLWYAADPLEEAGYDVPETWEDLREVTDGLAQDYADQRNAAPWCIGMESGGDTGWVATDWIENLVIRMHGPEVYDAWVAGELPFSSPEIRAAFEEAEAVWFGDGTVVGGTTGILLTPFLEAVDPMFDGPRCYFHIQAGFIAGLFPEDAEIGSDVAMTYLPAMADADERPVVFGGDTAAIHTENPVAGEFVQFLASPEGQEAWLAEEGAGAVSVREDIDTGIYPSEELVQQAEILNEAEVSRFDASDEMPGEVGVGAFWREVVAWLAGAQDLDRTLERIDAAWPDDQGGAQ
ncbi:ABC transporter substrate-binding protein [Egicoccus sp. AB-alg2]|uniref:ABC transporter substrate-binding protein n=1 Tax=Egicoccus sp. AB-alg2 TaxID=3242693 RepID=UPI00359E1C20